MATSKAKTVAAYLDELPAEKRAVITAMRELVRDNIPKGFEEGTLYGMIGWYIPLADYPRTYNKQPLAVASLAAQKNYFALYLPTYCSEDTLRQWLEAGFEKAGKKLDLGKSCLRFKKLDDLPLDVVAAAIGKTGPKQLISMYERSRAT